MAEQQDQAKFAQRQRRIYVNMRLRELANEVKQLREEKTRLDAQFEAKPETPNPGAPKPAAPKSTAPKGK